MCVGHETGRGERGGDLNLMGKELTMEYVCMEAERGLTRRKGGSRWAGQRTRAGNGKEG